MSNPNLSAFIWSIADLLRGAYKASDYGKVILPFTVLRRLDCVLGPTKQAVLDEYAVRTTQLQQKRAEVLAEVYRRLVITQREVEKYVSVAQWAGSPSKDEIAVSVDAASLAFWIYFDEQKIFLPEALCDQIDAFGREFRRIVIFFSTYRPHDLDGTPESHRKEALDVWTKADEKMRNDMPKVRRALEEQMRGLIEARQPT